MSFYSKKLTNEADSKYIPEQIILKGIAQRLNSDSILETELLYPSGTLHRNVNAMYRFSRTNHTARHSVT